MFVFSSSFSSSSSSPSSSFFFSSSSFFLPLHLLLFLLLLHHLLFLLLAPPPFSGLRSLIGVQTFLFNCDLISFGGQRTSPRTELWLDLFQWTTDKSRDWTVIWSLSECKDKLDIVFILDSSGSVSYTDFNLMLKFAGDVADVMNVSPDATRVADIVYSSSVMVHFDFDDYTTKDQVRSNFLTTTKRKQLRNVMVLR